MREESKLGWLEQANRQRLDGRQEQGGSTNWGSQVAGAQPCAQPGLSEMSPREAA